MASIKIEMDKLKQNQSANQKAIARIARRNKSKRSNKNKRRSLAPSNLVHPQGKLRPLAMKLDADMAKWVNTMTNPFGSDCGCQIPDDVVANTMVFKDYVAIGEYGYYGATNDLGGDSAEDPGVPGSTSGICFFLIPGAAEINTYYSSTYSNTDGSDTYYGYWHVGVALINSSGYLSGVNDSQYFYNVVPQSNEYLIFNQAAANDSLVSTLRISSCGFRVWPRIQMITDSSTLAIATIQAGSMSMDAFFTDFFVSTGRKSIYSGVNTNPNFKTYDNSQGVTCRFNTLQGNNYRYYNMKTQNTWSNQDNFLDAQNIPIVVINFTQSITGTIPSEDTVPYDTTFFNNLPIYFQDVFWLEGSPQVPTPLMPTKSPIDYGFDSVAKSIMASGDMFPTVTEGHSFRSFSKKLGKFTKHASNFVGRASLLGSKVGRALNRAAEEFEEKDG